jgi:hypothetical protein
VALARRCMVKHMTISGTVIIFKMKDLEDSNTKKGMMGIVIIKIESLEKG